MTEPLTDQQLTAIQAREAASWRGPWAVQNVPAAGFVEIGTPDGPIAQVSVHLRADAEFIAHARQDLPALLADNARLRAELADTAMMRDFNQRSAGHIATKRDLAEAAIASWDRGEVSGDAAVLMIRKALASGEDGESAPAVRCTCARSMGLHSMDCALYVPGHDLASPAAAATRLAEHAARAIFDHMYRGDFGNAERVLTEYANDCARLPAAASPTTPTTAPEERP